MPKGPMCGACHIVRFFEHVLYKPLGFTLLPWQQKDLRAIYGPASPADGTRIIQDAYIAVAKKNGKSFLIGGLPIYHLMFPSPHDRLTEVYGCAAAKDQAGIVFRTAATLVRGNSALLDKLRVIESTKRIVLKDGRGFYAVLSADGDVQDGIEPSLALKDEFHRWKNSKAVTVNDVVTKGMISRREPLEIKITTAGAQYESPLWWAEHERAQKHISGAVQGDSYHAAIYAADVQRVADDPEYWKSREARVAANPSHEDLGGFLRDTSIVKELNKALENPAEKPAYLRYHLNVPITSQDEPIIDMAAWQVDDSGIDMRHWPQYDLEAIIRKWGLIERTCFAGVDASWTTDLTSLQLVFPPFEGDDWHILGFAWLPHDRIPEIQRRCKVPLQDWAARGFLELTPGNAIDLSAVKRRIAWAREMFDLRLVCYDPYNFRPTAMELEADGYACMEVRQGYASLSNGTKKVLSLYQDRQLKHGNNPVMNWCASCVRLIQDNKDNVQAAKPERLKSSARIDMFSALATAMNQAMLQDNAPLVTVRSV